MEWDWRRRCACSSGIGRGALQCWCVVLWVCCAESGKVLAAGRGRNSQLGRGGSVESIAAYRTKPVEVLVRAAHLFCTHPASRTVRGSLRVADLWWPIVCHLLQNLDKAKVLSISAGENHSLAVVRE